LLHEVMINRIAIPIKSFGFFFITGRM